jgi:hypothetical protein
MGKNYCALSKPNGIFYIVDDHPSFRMFTTEADTKIRLANPYFFSEIPERVEMAGSYATDNRGEPASFYIWNHNIGEVIKAIIDAGLVIEFLHEFPYAAGTRPT